MATIELSSGLRERKKKATREALHRAAMDLVEAHGLAGTTVEAISERAGVAPRTFWSYFASKEQAVLGHDPGRPERLRQALLARPAEEDPLSALKHVLEEDLASRALDKERALRRSRLIRREPQLMAAMAAAFDQIEQALVAAVAERTGQDPEQDLYPGIVVGAACGACRAAQLRWAGNHGRSGLHWLVERAFDQLAAGLSVPAPCKATPERQPPERPTPARAASTGGREGQGPGAR